MVLALTGCVQHDSLSPAGYNLNKPEKMELGKVLNEISGITYDTSNNSLLCISDSKDKVIEINLKKEKLKDYTDKISESGQDLEDLVLLDTAVYVLASKGVIRQVPLHARSDSAVQIYPLDMPGKNDFETLYYDSAVNGLVMLCKSCENEKGLHSKSAYRFDLGGKRFDSSALYSISTESVRNILKDSDADFKPSAAAVHPIEKRLYILSSAGQLLVITDLRGRVEEAYKLNPDFFPQAEGLAFAPDGTMFISNEGKYGKPFLLIFSYTGKGATDKKNNKP